MRSPLAKRILAAALLGMFANPATAPAADEAAPERADWAAELDAFNGAVTRQRFENALETLNAPEGRWKPWAKLTADAALLHLGDDESGPEAGATPDSDSDPNAPSGASYRLAFAPLDRDAADSPPPPAERPTGLRGLRIVLDPGHIGGAWGQMEERSFAIGDGPRVQEGDLALAAAQRLRARLEARGAVVMLTRAAAEPVTAMRPKDFAEEAAGRLPATDGSDPAELDAARKKLAERLFYVTAEIRARAERVNRDFRPDLVLALHINAQGWKDPENPALTPDNNGHVIVPGCYLKGELADPATRLLMWRRLVRGYDRVELPLARALAAAMVEATGLPPYQYSQDNALRIDEAGYIWARNLLANRLYDCPVVYLEPWILNSVSVYPWAAAGDYDGFRAIGGRVLPSLPVAYADFVLAGLIRHYGEK